MSSQKHVSLCYFFSHIPGSHVEPTTVSLTFIHNITITASQNIQVYEEGQNMESKQNLKSFRSEMNNWKTLGRVGGWVGRSSNGGQQKTNACPYMSHDLNPSPGTSGMWEKHLPLILFQPASRKSPLFWNNFCKRLSLHTSQVAHQAGAYPSFWSMKRLGVFLLPPGWDASPSRWREALWE